MLAARLETVKFPKPRTRTSWPFFTIGDAAEDGFHGLARRCFRHAGLVRHCGSKVALVHPQFSSKAEFVMPALGRISSRRTRVRRASSLQSPDFRHLQQKKVAREGRPSFSTSAVSAQPSPPGIVLGDRRLGGPAPPRSIRMARAGAPRHASALAHAGDRNDLQPALHVVRNPRSLAFSSGISTFLMPPRWAASSFSLSPPIGSTRRGA